jgi:hypothetical protein
VSNRYEDEWWSVELPPGWSGEREGDTAMIGAEDGCGLLQVRSFRSDGRDIDDGDLRSLAQAHLDGGATLHRNRYGGFDGMYVYYRADDRLWYEWWLRSGRIALHATYHCPYEERHREEPEVARILGSLHDRDAD